MANPTQVTEGICDFLRNAPGARRRHGAATLTAAGDSYVMDGPSGRHSLLIAATDAARLDAHWQAFASHPANAA